MFNKLRNKLILMNLGITSLVILTVFSTIYIISTRSADNRPPMPAYTMNVYDDEMENVIVMTIQEEKQAAARDLLIALVVSGITIELVVVIISYLVAEEAIKPVREAYESQKIFIANASHEIKTPLAAISANLEAADIKNNRWIRNVEKETAKLAALNTELLTLARTDLVCERKIEETDLAKLVNEDLKILTPRMKNLTFKKKIILSQKIKINREDFMQIFSILMDNAIKYAGSKIYLELGEHELIVKNDGATIPKEALPHIFERFYQVDKTANGVGLGLAIAKSLAERNHWELTASSGSQETCFKLSF